MCGNWRRPDTAGPPTTKSMNLQNDRCPLCGGSKTPGVTTFTADLGSGVVVVRKVRATVCAQCGEEWIEDAVARRLEEVVADARRQRREVDVTAFP